LAALRFPIPAYGTRSIAGQPGLLQIRKRSNLVLAAVCCERRIRSAAFESFLQLQQEQSFQNKVIDCLSDYLLQQVAKYTNIHEYFST
jgi:hypothetical protein